MSRKEKLIERLRSRPNDFSFEEAVSLLAHFGYAQDPKGKTSGSRVAFIQKETKRIILMHRPHPQNCLRLYVIDDLIETLERNGDL